MAQNDGTLVIAPIRPTSDQDTYPTAYADELLGGHHAVARLTDLTLIPTPRREQGMTCWVIENSTLYVLSSGIGDNDWTVFSPGGAGGGITTVVWTQSTPDATWTIAHNLGRFPSVEVVDSSNRLVEGDVTYIDSNTIEVDFGGAFSGVAYLN